MKSSWLFFWAENAKEKLPNTGGNLQYANLFGLLFTASQRQGLFQDLKKLSVLNPAKRNFYPVIMLIDGN